MHLVVSAVRDGRRKLLLIVFLKNYLHYYTNAIKQMTTIGIANVDTPIIYILLHKKGGYLHEKRGFSRKGVEK